MDSEQIFIRDYGFIAELSELLRKYNAVINVNHDRYFDTENDQKIDMVIHSRGDNVPLCEFEDVLGYSITADNIMDFDKE